MSTPKKYSDTDNSHYVRGRLSHEPMDKEHLLQHLERVTELVRAMEPVPEEETDGCAFAVGPRDVDRVVEAHLLLNDLHDKLPHVQAWVAGYWWQGTTPHWSGFYGCSTKEQAEAVAAAAAEKEIKRYPNRTGSGWMARWTDISINSMVKPKAKVSSVIRGLYS